MILHTNWDCNELIREMIRAADFFCMVYLTSENPCFLPVIDLTNIKSSHLAIAGVLSNLQAQ